MFKLFPPGSQSGAWEQVGRVLVPNVSLGTTDEAEIASTFPTRVWERAG